MTNSTIITSGGKQPPSKADFRRYKTMVTEIHADIETVDQALFRIGRNLTAINKKQLYYCGGYATFADFCQAEFGKSRQQIYRLMQAFDTMQTLLEAGIQEEELPATERLCREIRKIGSITDEEQARIWKSVLRISRERGAAPTAADVQDVAAKEIKSPSAIDRQQTELIQKFEAVNRTLKVGLDFETLSPSFRRRLVGVLADIAESVSALIAAIKTPVIDERAPKEEAEKAE
jgi:hypothetical protein